MEKQPHLSSKQMLRYISAGMIASLIAIGLARFAYTPLLPELIDQHWFSADDAAYLGAANLAGYLLGALSGRPLAHRISYHRTLQIMMLLTALSFLACAFPLSSSWYFLWRLVSGITGGAIMVVVAATILPHIPIHRRNLASGGIFLGIGLGIFASATLIPFFLKMGLKETWLGLGGLSLLLTFFAWKNIPSQHTENTALPHTKCPVEKGTAFLVLYLQYALIAISIVAPAVFLVDFIVRGLQQSSEMGALFWGLYGIGSIIGPILYGYLADKWGAKPTLKLVLAVQMCVLITLALNHHLVLLAILSLIIGTLPPGIVPLVLARIHEMTENPLVRNKNWSKATVFFATSQAIAGYALSALFSYTQGNHGILFLVGGAALIIALGLSYLPMSQKAVK
ncbi:YbfB/YjiJ family MFS transporter [Rodentibacter myodis]|uniref:Major facilitator superfamily (MFS) profile domain-containing protein n=1 Tax=Rodentibacter myodis TaxID=1907939 RepID=A0A1V3JJY0_9PAST|nr:YbfB/YjiJ family MFS transporter [Rodentibacter myodis]OOF56954.1 hypothetical protein BKL49_10105 [Rodentibacter myodis]